MTPSAHPWGSIELTSGQRRALDQIESILASGPPNMPICIIGDFGSGKTTLARYWLASHFDDPERRVHALNRALLDALKREGDLADFAADPDKTRVFLRIALADALESAFSGADAVVLDAIELLHVYAVPLIPRVAEHARRGVVALICVPDSPNEGVRYELRPFECHVVRLDS
ncbi:hypothetical protein FJZ36_03435 [Candidatus Poribacteria bacterium]|nr:hypothetical protein [Candidatus Poribacteria bacterium]